MTKMTKSLRRAMRSAPASCVALVLTSGVATAAEPVRASGAMSAGASTQGESGQSEMSTSDVGPSSGGEATSRSGSLEGGFRTGIAVPVGKAGRGKEGGADTRDLGDLTPWRAPIWVDLSYRVSDSTSLGAYVQVGFGSSGDACDGDCTWADIRIGAQGTFRLSPGADMDPWLGVGLGYESLTFRTLRVIDNQNELRLGERLGGPELTLQGGLDFLVEPALTIGPYVSGTLATYMRDGIKCSLDQFPCADDSNVDGSGFHSWLGIGVRGTYNP